MIPRRAAFFILSLLALFAQGNERLDRRPDARCVFNVTFSSGAAIDRSFLGLTGTLTNGASIGANRYATFDGTNDYIDFGHDARQLSLPCTLAIWFNTRSQDQVAYATILGKYTSGSFNGIFLFMDTSERLVGFYGKDGSNYVGADGRLQSASSYKDNTWHHAVMRVTSSGASLWVDGASVDTDTWMGTAQVSTTTSAMRIADHTSGTAYPWKGDLDNVTLWNVELTDAEIRALYYEGRP